MKKTLFLSAILGAALCSGAFAAEYTITKDSGEIMFNNGADQHLSASQAGDIITLNVTGTGAHLESVADNGTATIAADLIVNSLTMNNGYSGTNKTYLFTGTVTGSGPITRGANQNGNNFRFTGDVSGYTGAITFSTKVVAGKLNELIFDASAREGGMAVNASSITMENGAILKTAGDVTFSGIITSATSSLGSGTATLASGAMANLGTLSYADGAALKVASGATLNFTSATTVVDSSVESGNGFNVYHFTHAVDSGLTLEDGSTVQLKGVESTVSEGTITSAQLKDYIVNETSATLDSAILAQATQVHVQQPGTALTVSGGSLAYEDIVFAEGAGLSSLAVTEGGSMSVVGNNDHIGFTTANVSVGAGSTLELKGHDALGYNTGDGKGSATPLIVLQGTEGNKAVLDSQDTSGGNPANLTFTTDLTLNGHTEVKGNNIKVFGMVLTATGTDNTVTNNLVLDKNMTVAVTGADDTLAITGNISGGNTLTQTGAGALTVTGNVSSAMNNSGTGTLTIHGSTIGNNVTLNNSGSGTTVLDSVVLGGRLNVYNSTGTTMTGGATTTANNSYALVVGNGQTNAEVTIKDGTYNLGNNHVGISATGTLTVDKTASLSVQDLFNSTDLKNDGILNIKGDATDKGSVTANGNAYVKTLNNNGGTATFNGIFQATTVNLTGDSTTTFNGATSIGTLTIADTAAIAGTGAVTITTGITAATPVDVTINNLTLNAGTTIELGENHTGHLTSTNLTVMNGATINADLVIADQGTITFNGGSVTMGCSVTFGEGSTVALGTAYLDELAANGKVLLFTDVESHSDNLESIAVTGDFMPGYLFAESYTAEGGVTKFNIYATPEPATATLSLLALAGLMARRRRH